MFKLGVILAISVLLSACSSGVSNRSTGAVSGNYNSGNAYLGSYYPYGYNRYGFNRFGYRSPRYYSATPHHGYTRHYYKSHNYPKTRYVRSYPKRAPISKSHYVNAQHTRSNNRRHFKVHKSSYVRHGKGNH